eukprot:332134_1
MESTDFSIFEHTKQKCAGYQNCSYLCRIITALKYFQKLVSTDAETTGKVIFIQFCIELYQICLDDYIHLISVHHNDLHQIVHQFRIYCNNINTCEWSRRHHRITMNIKKNTAVDEHSFYLDIFDTIHFYLFHLEHSGMRIIKQKIEQQTTDVKDDDPCDTYHFVDNEINFIQNEIEEKRKKYALQFIPFDNHTKFTIPQTLQNVDQSFVEITGNTSTFIDDMLNYIYDSVNKETKNKKHNAKNKHLFAKIKRKVFKSDNKNQNHEEILNLISYITKEEYDTDAIISHVDILDSSENVNANKETLTLNTNNNKYIHYIKHFIRYKTVSSASFSTGFHFFYHKFYKGVDASQLIKNEQWRSYEENDFGGETLKSLFVETHFNSIKQEALCSSFITIQQFTSKVIQKSNEYMKTKKCKIIRCIKDGDPLHYCIDFGITLKQSHLHALLLYCDFTLFCTSFSSTFRRNFYNEPVQLVKKRNSKYHHTSKHLTELVQYYGVTGSPFDDQKEDGPFYTGVSFCMNIPEFSVRLYGPTSTSKHKEIACRFAGRDGMIIQLNNHYPPGNLETFFDSSWISTYPEENERIFISARYKIEMQAIIIIETAKNYENIMTALYKFDAMISGQSMFGVEITKTDVSIVDSSIKYALEDSFDKSDDKLDKYIKDNFLLFAANKTQIILKLHWLNMMKNAHFTNFVTYPICKQTTPQKNNNNLFKPMIFELFPNLKNITIYTAHSSYPYPVYCFNLLSLLSILVGVSFPKSFKSIIIKDQNPDKNHAWLEKSLSKAIKRKFTAKKFNIEFKRTKTEGDKVENWIIIAKK